MNGFPLIPGFLDEWLKLADLQLQTGKLEMVERWKRMREGGVSTIPQNTLGHSLALILLLVEIVDRLEPYMDRKPNMSLLSLAVSMHDLPEIVLGDVHVPRHGSQNDIAECNIFCEMAVTFPFRLKSLYRDSFCLQYVTKPELDCSKLGGIMSKAVERLRADSMLEALIFRAVEEMDFYLYGLACLANHEPVPLVEVIYTEFEKFERLAKELPGFAQEFWTGDVRKWSIDLYRKHHERHMKYRQAIDLPCPEPSFLVQ